MTAEHSAAAGFAPTADPGGPRAALEAVRAEVGKAVIGQEPILNGLVICLLCRGHALLEGVPGVAKTLLVRSLAAALSLRSTRVQFTPDLMPGDVTGSLIYDAKTALFQFREGPVFTNLLLADEINRTPPKSQAALLEAMEERQVSVEGSPRPLPEPFCVAATQNPIEYEGTYPLPEAQLDRFLIRMRVGYPSPEDEWDILARRLERRGDEAELRPVVDRDELVRMQQAAEQVHVSEAVGRYIVLLVTATRESPSVQVGASPRGTLAVMKLARVKALLDGRDFVVPDDVKAVAVPALAHRLALRPELWVQRVQAEDVVRDCMDSVPVPTSPATT